MSEKLADRRRDLPLTRSKSLGTSEPICRGLVARSYSLSSTAEVFLVVIRVLLQSLTWMPIRQFSSAFRITDRIRLTFGCAITLAFENPRICSPSNEVARDNAT